jgi:hypothetical protein
MNEEVRALPEKLAGGCMYGAVRYRISGVPNGRRSVPLRSMSTAIRKRLFDARARARTLADLGQFRRAHVNHTAGQPSVNKSGQKYFMIWCRTRPPTPQLGGHRQLPASRFRRHALRRPKRWRDLALRWARQALRNSPRKGRGNNHLSRVFAQDRRLCG